MRGAQGRRSVRDMGLFKNMQAMQDQAYAQMNANQAFAQQGMADPAELALINDQNDLAHRGFEAQATVTGLRRSGRIEFGGGEKVEIDVQGETPAGAAFGLTISQQLLPDALATLTVGKVVTIKYHPERPHVATVWTW